MPFYMFVQFEALGRRVVFRQPVCTGATVIALTFEGGVAVAADRQASYGNMARYKKVSRLFRVNQTTLVGISGDVADQQFLKHEIECIM